MLWPTLRLAVGDFAFWDMQGSTDPACTGLGPRYLLYYLEKPDLPGPWQSVRF
jgi:hypothetical protein